MNIAAYRLFEQVYFDFITVPPWRVGVAGVGDLLGFLEELVEGDDHGKIPYYSGIKNLL